MRDWAAELEVAEKIDGAGSCWKWCGPEDAEFGEVFDEMGWSCVCTRLGDRVWNYDAADYRDEHRIRSVFPRIASLIDEREKERNER